MNFILALLITGPALSGTLVQTIGFGWMLFGIGIINFMYAPLLYFLRNPPTKEERQVWIWQFGLDDCRSKIVKTVSRLILFYFFQSLAMAEKSTISYKAFNKMEEEYP